MKHELRTLMLGLDGAGKTMLMYMMKLGDVVTTIPTIGFNVETIDMPRGCDPLTIWDVGGQDRIRPLWLHYFEKTQVLIFVVNPQNPERFADARVELHRVLANTEMAEVSIVIVQSFVDIAHVDKDSLLRDLGLTERGDDQRPLHYAETTSTDADGLMQVLKVVSTECRKKRVYAAPRDPNASELSRAEKFTLRSKLFLKEYVALSGSSFNFTEPQESCDLKTVVRGDIGLPLEVVTHVCSFLPNDCLLPSSTLHLPAELRAILPVCSPNAWLVNKAFFAASLQLAMERVIGADVDTGVLDVRAALYMKVPSAFRDAHVLLCAAITRYLLIEDSGLAEALELSVTCKKYNPFACLGDGAYEYVVPLVINESLISSKQVAKGKLPFHIASDSNNFDQGVLMNLLLGDAGSTSDSTSLANIADVMVRRMVMFQKIYMLSSRGVIAMAQHYDGDENHRRELQIPSIRTLEFNDNPEIPTFLMLNTYAMFVTLAKEVVGVRRIVVKTTKPTRKLVAGVAYLLTNTAGGEGFTRVQLEIGDDSVHLPIVLAAAEVAASSIEVITIKGNFAKLHDGTCDNAAMLNSYRKLQELFVHVVADRKRLLLSRAATVDFGSDCE